MSPLEELCEIRRKDISIHYITYESPKQINDIHTILYNGGLIILNDKLDIFPKIPAKYHSSIFFRYEILFNPTKHILVPRHRLATEDEIQSIRSDLNLPKIYSADIICRWNNFPLGSIIAIERKNTVYFRKLNEL